MGDPCADAKADLDRAETWAKKARGELSDLTSERDELAGEWADVDRRFQDGSSSSVTLDAEEAVAIRAQTTANGLVGMAKKALADAQKAYDDARKESSLTGVDLVTTGDALAEATSALEEAESESAAADREAGAAASRAAKATEYVKAVAKEREGVRTRQGTNATQLGLATTAANGAGADVEKAEAAVAAHCR